MTVTTAVRAGPTKTVAALGFALDRKTQWGTVEVTANMAPLDTFIMAKLPKGAVIVGGALLGDKLDSTGAGSACLSLNIGVDKAVVLPNGTTVTTLSTSNALAASWGGFGSEGGAVTGYKPEATGRNLPLGGLLLSDGPLLCTDDCNVVITIITSQGGVVSGTLTLVVDYYASTLS